MSGDTIGAAEKTIASRITRANTGDASAEEVSNADKAYQSLGINIRDKVTGNFADLDTTLTSLSAVWSNLNSVQRSYIAEQSAGVKKCFALLTRNSKVINFLKKTGRLNYSSNRIIC